MRKQVRFIAESALDQYSDKHSQLSNDAMHPPTVSFFSCPPAPRGACHPLSSKKAQSMISGVQPRLVVLLSIEKLVAVFCARLAYAVHVGGLSAFRWHR